MGTNSRHARLASASVPHARLEESSTPPVAPELLESSSRYAGTLKRHEAVRPCEEVEVPDQHPSARENARLCRLEAGLVNEALLSTLLKSWGDFDFVNDVRRLGLTSVGGEDLLEQFRKCARTLGEHYLPGTRRELALAAYDWGVSSGFYGSESAVGLGTYRNFDRIRVRGRSKSDRFAYEIYGIGMQHGLSIRCCATGKSEVY